MQTLRQAGWVKDSFTFKFNKQTSSWQSQLKAVKQEGGWPQTHSRSNWISTAALQHRGSGELIIISCMSRMFYLQDSCFNAVVHRLWCENIREIKSLYPGISSVITSKSTAERLSCRLLTALPAGELITLDGRGGDAETLVHVCFNRSWMTSQHLTAELRASELRAETQSLCVAAVLRFHHLAPIHLESAVQSSQQK